MIKRPRKSQAQPRTECVEFSVSDLKNDIVREAKVLKISENVAKTVAEKAASEVEKWVQKRSAITVEDLNRQIAKELKKYNADLAYVYQIRDKII